MSKRLNELEAGQGPDILRAVDERERHSKTWCVGVRWQYEQEDLVDIVRVRALFSPKLTRSLQIDLPEGRRA